MKGHVTKLLYFALTNPLLTYNLTLNTSSLEMLTTRKAYTAHLDINGYSQATFFKQDNWTKF